MMGLIVIFHRTSSLKYTFAGRNYTTVGHFVLNMYLGMLFLMMFQFERSFAKITLVWSDFNLKSKLFARGRLMRLLT